MRVGLAFGMGLLMVAGAAAAPERFVQDRFVIGFWVDPPLDDQADQRYAEIAAADFTLAIGGFGGNTPEQVRRGLDLCEKNGLKALVHVPEVSEATLPDHPACWGYALRDEPNCADFPALREKVDAVRALRPGRLGYINLFPNYASEQQLGAPTYDDHVRRFAEEVDPDVLSMDHYPLLRPDADGRQGYCDNLAVMRKYALEKGVPFWNFFNTMPFGPHSDPTEAQLRWQINASIAYGAKGVLYFCYYTPLSPEFPKGGAIITRDDRRTRHYDEAQRINARLKQLGGTLMRLRSTGVYRVPRGEEPMTVLQGTGIARIDAGDYLVGTFLHADGRRGLWLMNYDFAYSAWPTIEFDKPADAVSEVSPITGEAVPVKEDSPDMDGLQLSLDAAEGRLFLLP